MVTFSTVIVSSSVLVKVQVHRLARVQLDGRGAAGHIAVEALPSLIRINTG